MTEATVREAIVRFGRSMFERGLTFGSSGNISARLDDGWLMTPTNVALDRLDPGRLSRLDAEGRLISGDAPTKESFLHIAMYRERAAARAVVHLHSTYSVAVSCLADVDAEDVLPPVTAYYVMRVGALPLIPYHPPGDLDGMAQSTIRLLTDAALHRRAAEAARETAKRRFCDDKIVPLYEKCYEEVLSAPPRSSE